MPNAETPPKPVVVDENQSSKPTESNLPLPTGPEPMDPDPTIPDPTTPTPMVPVYNACPMDGDCKIMPLGDSITYGIEGYSRGGYRVPLLKKAWAANRKITFVGDQKTGPKTLDGKPFPQANQGHSGWTIADINKPNGQKMTGIHQIVDEALKKHTPHIVLLQIGTNDLNNNTDIANAPKRLSALIDKIILNAPEALIVVAQIVPITVDEKDRLVQIYNAAIPAIVDQKAKAGAHVVLVDMHKAIKQNSKWKTDLFGDALHPKDAGFDVMANVWWAAISSHLK